MISSMPFMRGCVIYSCMWTNFMYASHACIYFDELACLACVPVLFLHMSAWISVFFMCDSTNFPYFLMDYYSFSCNHIFYAAQFKCISCITMSFMHIPAAMSSMYLPPLVTCATMSVLHCTIYFHGFHVNDTSHACNCMSLICDHVLHAGPACFWCASASFMHVPACVWCLIMLLVHVPVCGKLFFVHIPTWSMMFFVALICLFLVLYIYLHD